jgi:hypothetical protein
MTFGEEIFKTLQAAENETANGTEVICTDLAESFDDLTLQVVGITTATITWEASIDNTNWVAVLATNLNSGATATTTTANGLFRVQVTGFLKFRARISAYTAGTITVSGYATRRR